MTQRLSDRVVEAIPGLDTIADAVGKALDPVLGPDGPKEVQDLLNGTWFGHPLHPAVVVLPLGAWTSTLVLDLAGMEEGADLKLKIGMSSAVLAAATGAAQWKDTQGKPRRVGILHASLNSLALVCNAASWLLRARDARQAGIVLSTTGLCLGSISAWLGGDLAYDLGVGINHTAFDEAPAEWTDVLDESELQENAPRRVVANGVAIMVLRQGSETFALSATCTHLGGPLDEGTIEGDTVTCPWHGSVFCVRDGALRHGPATAPQPAFDVRVQNGKVAVRARS